MLGEMYAMWLCWATIAISAVILAIVAWRDALVTTAVAIVLLGVGCNLLLYRIRPVDARRTVFLVASVGLVILGLAWFYAVGT